MSGFSADWLALREPFDAAARDLAWPLLGQRLAALRASADVDTAPRPRHVLDLACGTGANLRALAPRLGGAQIWRLVDHDPALLAALPLAMARWAHDHGYAIGSGGHGGTGLHVQGPGFSAEMVSAAADLGTGLDALGQGPVDLVTASALLDLVSAGWLENLVHHACRRGAAVLCVLTVDGNTTWEPADTCDAEVQRLFSLHQRRDKGFGPALGHAACAHAATALSAARYTVEQAASDWVIDAAGGRPQAQAMLATLIEGIASAAIAQQPDAIGMVRAWQHRRMAMIGRTRLRVGHQDLIAVPAQWPDPGPTTGLHPSKTA